MEKHCSVEQHKTFLSSLSLSIDPKTLLISTGPRLNHAICMAVDGDHRDGFDSRHGFGSIFEEEV
jgi:hypothetical protein